MTTSHVHAASASKPVIRPEWTPATIALMVLGFIVFWPLGLAMLAYIVWGDRLPALKRDVNKATDSMFSTFSRATGTARTPTGNVAFDDWRSAELKRLDEERARLEAMRDEFEDYARELRRAKDQEEFDRFMAHRRTTSGERSGPTIDAA
ncbi:membrane protein [Rhizobium albus]|nr:membrane protein [Rhizobium albus]